MLKLIFSINYQTNLLLTNNLYVELNVTAI